MKSFVESIRARHFFIAAFLLRAAATVALYHPLRMTGDTEDYVQGAQWFFGQAPVMAVAHPPIYSLFLGLFYVWPGYHQWIPTLLQVAISSLCVSLVYALAHHLWGKQVAFWASLWVLCDPFLIYFTSQILSETLFTTLFIASLTIYFSVDHKSEMVLRFLSGLFLALTCLCRNAILPMAWMFPLFILIRAKPAWPRRIRLALVWVVGFAIPMLAWASFMEAKTGHFQIVVPNLGWSTYEGLNPRQFDDPEGIRVWLKAQKEEEIANGLSDPFARDVYFRRKSKDWIQSHPRQTAGLMARKFFKFWRIYPYRSYYSLGFCMVSGLYMAPLLALALWGGWIGLRLRKDRVLDVIFLALFVFIFSASTTLTWTEVRYRVPLDPILAIFAGLGIFGIYSKRPANAGEPT